MRYNVYKIWKASGFSNFVTDYSLPNQNALILFDGERKGKSWNPLPVKVENFKGDDWDIFTVYGPSALILKPWALNLVLPLLDPEGYEILELDHDGTKYSIVNVLEVVECLNLSKSEFRPTGTVKKYVFEPGKFTKSLFKIPQEATGSLFVVTDENYPSENIKSIVEKNNLRGISFCHVWKSG